MDNPEEFAISYMPDSLFKLSGWPANAMCDLVNVCELLGFRWDFPNDSRIEEAKTLIRVTTGQGVTISETFRWLAREHHLPTLFASNADTIVWEGGFTKPDPSSCYYDCMYVTFLFDYDHTRYNFYFRPRLANLAMLFKLTFA